MTTYAALPTALMARPEKKKTSIAPMSAPTKTSGLARLTEVSSAP